MKTIFITSFHPLISRNILATGLLNMLGRTARIVLLVPDFKKEYFKKIFGGKNILVEGVSGLASPSLGGALGIKNAFFKKLALALTDTDDLYIKNRTQLYRDWNLPRFLLYSIPAALFGGSKAVLKLFRACDHFFSGSPFFRDLLSKYKPDLVFAADAQNEFDVRLIQNARRARVKTIAMVRSWDNLTSKGVLRVLPDCLLAHNEIVKEEAVRYNFADQGKISVIGIPHYDKYLLPSKTPKANFFEKFGFDLTKKLILYSPIGNRYIRKNRTDKYILETLSSLDANILVRMPPTDAVDFEGFKSRGAKVFFDETGFGFERGGKKMNEINPEDDERLKSSLSFCDVLVTGQSTIAIDAAVFDKPAVVAAFDAEPGAYWDSVRRYYDYEYYRKFREYSGIYLAKSPSELLRFVTSYLTNPDLDKNVREKIISDQIYKLDGKATERLANIILSNL